MQGFAIFRLPYAEACMLLSGEVYEVLSCANLSGRQGFVMAPFAPAPQRPILVIEPTVVDSLPPMPVLPSLPMKRQADYGIDFANFHSHLLNNDFLKLVLSRSVDMVLQGDDTPLQLFHRACERYPRMFISLAYTPQSGMWLAATPEILLAGQDNQWQTVALAGTMPYSDDVRWSDKNIQEQRYVATYVTEQLEHFTNHFTEDGPHTIRAGHLAHLRSDFRFTLSRNTRVGELLQALHPTPAVCGLPKQEAFKFILSNEHHDRSYYSGFMGPLFVDGQTNLFVTLRCMQIFSNGYRLYAGGGLLKDSEEQQEWQETETKLDTLRNLF